MHPYVHAAKTPDKPAYIMADSGEVVTYRQLEERSNQGAQLFRSLGLRPGDSFAMMMENNARFFEICWAAQRSGLIYTAISSRLTAAEAEYIANDCGAKLLIMSTVLAEQAQQLRETTAGVQHYFSVGGGMRGYQEWEATLATLPVTPVADQVAGRDMLYSSGTTGRPKGIKPVVKDEAIDEPAPLHRVANHLLRFSADTVYMSTAPLYHAGPLRVTMYVMREGGTSIVMEHFNEERALALIDQYKVTHSQWVPTMFVRMLKLPDEVRNKYDVSTMTMAMHGAAPCPVQVKERMIEWWGPVFLEYYGATENNGFTLCTSEEWLQHKGSAGRSVLGEAHILDDDGAELPSGEAGNVYFAKGPVFEYHNDPQKTAESRNAQGWSTLGDIGYLDQDGYLYLTDRKSYMIISGGVNIYPQEVEDLLINHSKVLDAAVIGVPNEDFGEEVKAVVQPRDMRDAGPVLEAELIAYCKAHLSSIKCPRSVDFEQELPRHPTGKLYKRLLKDRYWAEERNKSN
ncbi:MAG: AMP-dependent synthetase and ligase [Burkholderia sp.]|nr:AMP-dependent synthetase and ligase [Burkholderia sp.]